MAAVYFEYERMIQEAHWTSLCEAVGYEQRAAFASH
jgi:hypothetical protein